MACSPERLPRLRWVIKSIEPVCALIITTQKAVRRKDSSVQLLDCLLYWAAALYLYFILFDCGTVDAIHEVY